MLMLGTSVCFERAGLLLVLLLGCVSVTAAQAASKTLEWSDVARITCGKVDPSTPTRYEIELEDILIDGKSVFIGEPFVGDVRNLVFVVKNISDRPISFVQITLLLPEVKTPPQIPFIRTTADSKDKPVNPGEQTELRVPAGKLYDWVKDTVASQGLDLQSIRRAAVYAITVVKDGSPVTECIKTRDPRNECPPR